MIRRETSATGMEQKWRRRRRNPCREVAASGMALKVANVVRNRFITLNRDT
jgi:hypothetical protein